MSKCNLCQTCRACGAVAWCEGDPAQIETPCPHFEPLCGDCLEECPACCEAMLRASLQAAFGRFHGDPFAHPPVRDEHAALADLAAEARAVTDAFWNGVGDRSHIKDRHE